MNPEILLIVLILFGGAVLIVVPYWFIYRKAGFDPSFSLLMLIPLVNFGMLYYLAFSEWPDLKQGQQQTATEQKQSS